MLQARMRAEPVAGAFVATIMLCAFLAPPVLFLALLGWLAVRASRSSSSRAGQDVDPEFSVRFRKLEEGILKTN